MPLIPGQKPVISSKPSIEPKRFDKMTPKEKRVAIARDVLAQLKSGKFVANSGDYCNISYEDRRAGRLEIGEANHCEVCGIGSLVVSKFIKSGQLQVAATRDGEIGNIGFASQIHKELGGIFSAAQLRQIEATFEAETAGGCGAGFFSEEMGKKGNAFFGNKKFSDHERLRLIMENVIVNDGKFIPDPNHPNHFIKVGAGRKTKFITPGFTN